MTRAQKLPVIDESDLFGVAVIDLPTTRHDRYNNNGRDRDKSREYDRRRTRKRAAKRQDNYLEKEIVIWDGEGSSVPNGVPQPYMLFGNTDGELITAPELSTKECLNLILEADPRAIHVGFSFGYDVNQILRDLPISALSVLARRNSCRWEGYVIEYVPEKWFTVRRKGSRGIKIFDCFHFFNCALVTNDPQRPGALDKYGIGTPEQRAWLAQQKMDRPYFSWEEIDEVIEYWRLENKLTRELMYYIRELFAQAGFYLKSWHGPGALARELLNNHGVKDAKADTRSDNIEVWIAARYAFAAGRFEPFLAGFWEGPAYQNDIRSAYPYAIQFLPNLATGKWRRHTRINRGRIRRESFALYHIKYDAQTLERGSSDYKNKCRPRPLFRRLKNDRICWPDRVEGWYWSPEAELVKDDPAATFVEAWIYEDDGTRPLAFIAEIYRTREYHKSRGNAIQEPFKLAMNSCYGQFAQRAGWQNQKPKPGPPPYHQLEWAGYITSMCRAMIHRAAIYAYDNDGLVTIDTDAVLTTVPIPEEILDNGIGKRLGQWDCEEYESLLIWQNGFYWLKKDGVWKKCRTRGAPRGTIPIDKAWDALEDLDSICYEKKVFTGFRLALKQKQGFRFWRSWRMLPHEVQFGGGPSSKRQHVGQPGSKKGFCRVCTGIAPGPLHNLHPMPLAHAEYEARYNGNWSYMHHLPWLEQEKNAVEPTEDPEEEDLWEVVTL